MTRNIFTVMLYELKRNLLRKGFLFTTFGLPVLGFVILFGSQLLAGGGDEDASNPLNFDLEGVGKVGYVDFSGEFADPGELAADITILYGTEEEAKIALDAAEIDTYFVIPENYLETGDVRLVAPRFSLAALNDAPMRQLFYSQFINDVDPSLVQRLVVPANIEAVTLDAGEADEAIDLEAQESRDQGIVQLLAILFFLAIFGTNGYLMQTVIEEKETRLIEILISTIKPMQLLVGKILALGLLGLFQLAVYIAAIVIATTISSDTGTFLDNLDIPVRMILPAVVYFILGYFLFAAAFGAVGAISTSISEGPSLSVIFVLPAILPWVLAPIIAEEPNGTTAVVLSLIPVTSPLGMIMRLSVTDVPVVEIAISLALLMLSIVATMWLSGRLFRVQTLLSGKTPSIRDIPKLIAG